MTVKSLLGVCLCVLASLIACQQMPAVLGQPVHQLTITIEAEPPTQPFSFGIYDTMFPFNLMIHICNNLSTEGFPGGNITGVITPPSGDRYSTPLEFSVISLRVGDCEQFVKWFKPVESGVHTVHFDTVSTLTFYNPIWQVSGGFLAFDIEPVSTMIGLWSLIVALALGFLSIVVSVALPVYQERRKQRRLIKTQRPKAYERLYGILERYGAKASTTSLEVTVEDLTQLQMTVEDNSDVLYESTVMAWRNRIVEKNPFAFKVGAESFFNDVLNYHARLDKRNPYHDLDSQ